MNRNIPVLRENFEFERIQIAFNPLEEKFEVVDAAILRDKAFLPDISILWSDQTDVFEILDKYLDGLASSREVTSDEKKIIKKSIWPYSRNSGTRRLKSYRVGEENDEGL